MSKIIVDQQNNEIVIRIDGDPRTYSIPFSSEDDARLVKPEIREIIWAIERSYEKSPKKDS